MSRRAYPWVGAAALAAGTVAAVHDPLVPMKAVWLLLLAYVARRFGRLAPAVVIAVPTAVVLALALLGLRSPVPHPWREEVVVVAPLLALATAGAATALARR